MTIEERIDKLTERHEALTQFVELMAHTQKDQQTLMGQLMESIDALTRVAHLHERRISDLEDRQT